MIHRQIRRDIDVGAIPRTRGGDPGQGLNYNQILHYSPHTRGVILKLMSSGIKNTTIPRTRGGDPYDA